MDNEKSKFKLEREYAKINIQDVEYPEILRRINNPPENLYYKGRLNLLKNKMVAIVGSRKSSAYGRWVAKELAERLSMCNLTVVSGLAVGIDTCAHSGAVGNFGSTVAVLGAGLDIRYPTQNLKLRDEIEEKGLVLTEYEEGQPPAKYTFPQRNRIISGLAEAIVVVEGGINSGAIITAEIGVNQGKQVYAVPGNINNEYSIGTNKLIRDGAIPLVLLDDIIYDLGLMPAEEKARSENLSEVEKKVINILRNEGEMDINEIYNKMDNDNSEINGIITVLEIKGIVFSSLGKIFLAKR